MKLRELKKNTNSIILEDNTVIEDCLLPTDIGIEDKPLKYWDYDLESETFSFDQEAHEQYKQSLIDTENLHVLQNKQKILKEAYLLWETKVIRNIELNDPTIDTWFKGIEILSESSFINIPSRVLAYIENEVKEQYNW